MEIRPYLRKPIYYETDQMGIINHTNYIHWFEEARTDFMEQIGFGYDKAAAAGIDFALLGLSCQYRSMVRFGETVQITLSLPQLTPTRITVAYEVRDLSTGALRTTGETQHCYFDSRRQRPVALNRALPQLYALFEQYRAGQA